MPLAVAVDETPAGEVAVAPEPEQHVVVPVEDPLHRRLTLVPVLAANWTWPLPVVKLDRGGVGPTGAHPTTNREQETTCTCARP